MNELTKISERPESSIEKSVPERLIRLAELIRKDGAPYPLTPQLVNVWVCVFVNACLTATQVEIAFDRAERSCKFWPSPADILVHIERGKEVAATEAADQAWHYVLDLRRRFWNPDMRGGFTSGMPKLSPRIDRACRAAGVFRDHDSVEALHVWAKKKFVESFQRWDETEEFQRLIPDGEVKDLLAGVAQRKALSPSERYEAMGT